MPIVELSESEWTQVIGYMSYAPARECMPLMNKIGAQISAQILANQPQAAIKQTAGNSQEAGHERGH